MFPKSRWQEDLRQPEDYAENTGNVGRGDSNARAYQGRQYRGGPGSGGGDPTWIHGRNPANAFGSSQNAGRVRASPGRDNHAGLYIPGGRDGTFYGQPLHQYPYNPAGMTGHNFRERSANHVQNMFRSNIEYMRQYAIPLVTVHFPSCSGYYTNTSFNSSEDSASITGAASSSCRNSPHSTDRMPTRRSLFAVQGNPAFFRHQDPVYYMGDGHGMPFMPHGFHANVTGPIYIPLHHCHHALTMPLIQPGYWNPAACEIDLALYIPWLFRVAHIVKMAWAEACFNGLDILMVTYTVIHFEMEQEIELFTAHHTYRVDNSPLTMGTLLGAEYFIQGYLPRPRPKIVIFSDLYGLSFLGRIVDYRYFEFDIISRMVYKGTTDDIFDEIKQKTRGLTFHDTVIIFCGTSDFKRNSVDHVLNRIDRAVCYLGSTNVVVCNLIRSVNKNARGFNNFVQQINSKLDNRYEGMNKVFDAKLNESLSDEDFTNEGYKLKQNGLGKIAAALYELLCLINENEPNYVL